MWNNKGTYSTPIEEIRGAKINGTEYIF